MTLIDKLTNKINYKINELVTDPKAEEAAAQKEREAAIVAAKQKAEDANQEKDKAPIEIPKTDSQLIMGTAFTTIIVGVGIFLILLFGSLVCNMSIHRHIAIRLLYFIYGTAIGIGMIFVSLINPIALLFGLIGLGVLKYSNTLPHWYAFIPLTTTPSDSFLGKLIKAPFYWNPEDPRHKSYYVDALKKYQTFLESGLLRV